MAVPGIDVALIGPSDLSISLGVPGQMEAPTLKKAINTTLAACQQQNIAPGIHINSIDLAAYWAKQGMKVVSSGSETGLLMQAGRALTLALNEALGK